MGPATVDAPWYNFALPKTLHRGLYEITLGDASASVTGPGPGNISNNSNNKSNNHSGVPGFPDFPDFWVGESSGGQKKHTSKSTTKNTQVPKRRMSGCSVDAAIDDDLARRVSTLFAQARARGRDRTISKSKRRQQQRRTATRGREWCVLLLPARFCHWLWSRRQHAPQRHHVLLQVKLWHRTHVYGAAACRASCRAYWRRR